MLLPLWENGYLLSTDQKNKLPIFKVTTGFSLSAVAWHKQLWSLGKQFCLDYFIKGERDSLLHGLGGKVGSDEGSDIIWVS